MSRPRASLLVGCKARSGARWDGVAGCAHMHLEALMVICGCRNSCTRAWGGQARRPGGSRRRLCAEGRRTGRRRARPPVHAASQIPRAGWGGVVKAAPYCESQLRACLQRITGYQQKVCVRRSARLVQWRRHLQWRMYILQVLFVSSCAGCLRSVCTQQISVPWGALEHAARAT